MLNVKNPETSIEEDVISLDFSIMSYSSEGYPIDAANGLEFSIGCAYPCETCATE